MKRIAYVFTASLSLSLLAAGCAEIISIPAASDHPASPDAAEAPVLRHSDTLALTPAPSDGTATADTSSGRADHGSGHHSHGAHASASEASIEETTGSGSSADTQPTAGTQYVCPMHPKVGSDVPGKCPKCKMKLVKKAAPATQGADSNQTEKPETEGGHEHESESDVVVDHKQHGRHP